jgi:hypothetical protein
VDIDTTGKVTGGDGSQNGNGNEDDNQPFIADDDEQSGIIMETVEVNPPVHPKTSGVLEGGTAGVL